jgi:N-acetylmuramoyl-L-alanine amidase
MIVLHYTAMQTAGAALDRLCDPRAEVSAHYLIGEAGRVWHLVDENMRAWHAGAGQWGTVGDVNSRSIGIELANTGAHPFPAPQMAVLEDLVAGIMRRWRIAPERVIGHSDMAPARKHDPGPRFDWRRLARSGLAVWPDAQAPAPASMAVFLRHAATFGYRTQGDVTADDILRAFRARFRPGVAGALDGPDCAMIADLARRFPVDRVPATA